MLANFLKKALFSRMFVAEEGKLELLKSEYMLVHVPAMGDIIYYFSKIKSGKKRLYDIGFESGEQVMKDFKLILPKSKLILSTMMGLQEMMGWGNFKLKKYDQKKKYMLIHWDSTIAKSIKKKFGKQEDVICSWPSGVMAGAIGVMLDLKMECKEKKCIAKGDDCCELILRGV